MPRYIDADALICEICLKDCECTPEECGGKPCDEVKRIMDAHTISLDEVRGAGEWEDAKQHGLCRCSVCKDCYIEKDYITQAKWRFCPSCGARMKGAESETNE